MDLNWRAGAEGLLGGYQAVLAQKMKEDYENRMEEARMNRQMNLEKWKFDQEKPYKDREYALKETEHKDSAAFRTESLNIQKENQIRDDAYRSKALDYQREQANAAALERKENREWREGAEQRALDLKEKEINLVRKLQDEEIKKDAIEIKEIYSKKYNDPAMGEAAALDFLEFGGTRAEWNKSKSAVSKEAADQVFKITGEAISKSRAEYTELSQTDEGKEQILKEYAEVYGKPAANASAATSSLLRYKGLQAKQVAESTILGKQNAEPEPTARQLSQETLNNLSQAIAFEEKATDPNAVAEAKKVFSSLSREQKDSVLSKAAQLKGRTSAESFESWNPITRAAALNQASKDQFESEQDAKRKSSLSSIRSQYSGWK